MVILVQMIFCKVFNDNILKNNQRASCPEMHRNKPEINTKYNRQLNIVIYMNVVIIFVYFSKIVRSVDDEFEEHSPTFSATSFYSSKGQGGYLTPAERQKRRDELGEILPTKPPLEKQRTTKTKSHQSSSKGSHTIQRARRSGQTLQKSKTKGKIGDKSHPKSLDELSSKTVTKSLPNKKTINKSPKKSPKKSSPSKRTPRKSPRRGVKKAVKLYLQGLKKKHKAARRTTAMAGQRNYYR